MLYVCCPLSLRNVDDLLHEQGIDISHELVRFWWNRFGRICQRIAHDGLKTINDNDLANVLESFI